MTSTYFLRSARLGFREWTDRDLELATALWGDPEVTRLIGGPFSAAQIQQRLLREVESQTERGIQYWPLFLLATDEHIGCCGLRPYDQSRHIYELGFHILKSQWGKGYASEAARAVMGYAFDAFGASALFAGHNPENEVSRRLLHKLGFRFTHNEYYPPTGLDHPSYILTISDFQSRRREDG